MRSLHQPDLLLQMLVSGNMTLQVDRELLPVYRKPTLSRIHPFNKIHMCQMMEITKKFHRQNQDFEMKQIVNQKLN
jgi:hypothetical protein